MPVRIRPSRGLADLHTLAGRADRQIPNYKAFLRISFLELERARHDQEIATIRRRLASMLARCGEIEAEKSRILAAAETTAPRPAPTATPRNRHRSPPRRPGFHFAY
jgi:hypothetical protein